MWRAGPLSSPCRACKGRRLTTFAVAGGARASVARTWPTASLLAPGGGKVSSPRIEHSMAHGQNHEMARVCVRCRSVDAARRSEDSRARQNWQAQLLHEHDVLVPRVMAPVQKTHTRDKSAVEYEPVSRLSVGSWRPSYWESSYVDLTAVSTYLGNQAGGWAKRLRTAILQREGWT